MPDEASITIVARMRDEASDKMKALATNTKATSFSMLQLQTAFASTGSALTGIGSVLNQLGGESTKTASQFIMITGAMLSTGSAILTMLPKIQALIGTLRSLAVTQAIVHAFSGPPGWAALGASAVIAGGATAGIIALSNQGSGGGRVNQVVNINTPAFTGSAADARKFGREMQTIQRAELRLGR